MLSTLAIATIICALAASVCAVRVFQQKLARLYPAFTAYLIYQIVLLTLSSVTGANSTLYTWVYIGSEPVTWVIYSLMIRELYNQIFDTYPGIAMFGRWSVYAAVGLAVILSLVTHLMTRNVLRKASPFLIPTEITSRNIVFGMAFAIIILLALIARFPLKLHRNVFVNCVALAALLFSEALELLVDHLTNLSQTRMLDLTLMAFNIGCFSIWAALLSVQGARTVIHIHSALNPIEERKLLRQLETLNSLGLRSAQK